MPEEILRKPGPLTRAASGSCSSATRRSGSGCCESLGIDPVAEWVLHHHERWDGSGYPDGLPGDQIPLGARIIFVADAYDAMTSERVYRRRVLADEAVAELDAAPAPSSTRRSSTPWRRAGRSESLTAGRRRS